MIRQVKEICEDFFGYTSLHGLGRFGAASVIPHKVFWTLAFLGSAGMCFYQVYRLGVQFESEPTTTTLEIEYEDIDFPKVTVCNMNPLKFSEVQRVETLYQVIEAAANNSGLNISHFIQGSKPNFTYQEELQWPSWEPTVDEIRQLFMSRMSGLDILSLIKTSMDEFVLQCFYNGFHCAMSEWKEDIYDDFYGNCHVFYPNLTVEAANPHKGLRLILNVQAEEYIPFITDSVGVVIDIKRINDTPTPETTGMAISTGFHTSVAIWQKEKILQRGRKGKCTKDSYGFNNKLHCIDVCLGRARGARCKCANSMKYSSGTTQMCNSFSGIACNTRSGNSEIYSSCSQCKDLCRSMEFIPSFSIKSWPSPSSEIMLKDTLTKSLNFYNYEVNLSTVDFDTNFVSVDIFFSSLRTERITENLAYTDESFLSDIGGQLGLWIGMSVLSLAELCELIILILIAFCIKRKVVNKIDVKPKEQNVI